MLICKAVEIVLIGAPCKFVELIAHFPEEYRDITEIIGNVYHHDSQAKEQKMSDEERLRFHQEQSGPLMEDLKKWLEKQIVP